MNTPNPKGFPTESPIARLANALREARPDWSWDARASASAKRRARANALRHRIARSLGL